MKSRILKNRITLLAAIYSLLAIGLIGSGYILTKRKLAPVSAPSVIASNKDAAETTYTESDLKPFDGTDPNKPIYIGLNGFVYDVSAGREYYQSDGPYHYLAGKDSSVELNEIGGAIISRKYPVIGKLIK